MLHDIKAKGKVFLPAGKAKFNWIDVQNIGEVAALLLNDFETYNKQAIEITGMENVNFQKTVEMISRITGKKIQYEDANLLKFYFTKRKEKEQKDKIIVMMMLHYLHRFQKEPEISSFYEQVTGKKPVTLEEFIIREKTLFG